MRGVLHKIETDLLYEDYLEWDWKLFCFWLEIWATKHETT